MVKSPIKRAPGDFFQLRRFKDFRHRPGAYDFKTFCSRSHKNLVTNQTDTDKQFLQICRKRTFQFRKTPDGDLPDIGRRLAGYRSATGQRSEHHSDVELMNYNGVRYQYTILQYIDQLAKVYVCDHKNSQN